MHTLVLDGVFSEARPGQLTFHPAPPPINEDVAQVLATVRARVGQLPWIVALNLGLQRYWRRDR